MDIEQNQDYKQMKVATTPQQGSLPFSYKNSRINHWNNIAIQMDNWTSLGEYYQHRLQDIYKLLIHSDERVLEIGCGKGDLLASVKPSYGVGIDFSNEMIKRACVLYPELNFICGDIHEVEIHDKFDTIILSDLLNDVWDVQTVLELSRSLSTHRTRIIINSYSRLWELPLAIAQSYGLAKPVLQQNWLTVDDIKNLLNLADFEVIKSWPEIILPLPIPLLSQVCNRYLAKIFPFRIFALTNFIIARPQKFLLTHKNEPTVTIVVPARNEAGNISEIIRRTPKMGGETEIIFVEGHSTDKTYETIEKEIQINTSIDCKLYRQDGHGKGDAVRLGFTKAKGDILIILDADLTVPPEDLPRFYEVLYTQKGDFVNGVRLIYPMENQAMRFFNLLGNKLFTIVFSFLLGQPIKDTLCGTKALWKNDYERIVTNRNYFGDFDPFGDFDLLFGASKLNLKIIDLPVRYRARTYGTTNIQRWKHGILLLRMVYFASKKIKFV